MFSFSILIATIKLIPHLFSTHRDDFHQLVNLWQKFGQIVIISKLGKRNPYFCYILCIADQRCKNFENSFWQVNKSTVCNVTRIIYNYMREWWCVRTTTTRIWIFEKKCRLKTRTQRACAAFELPVVREFHI